MKKYLLAGMVGVVLSVFSLGISSCVQKTQQSQVADAGTESVGGSMSVGVPTIEVSPQVTDAVTQTPPAPLVETK